MRATHLLVKYFSSLKNKCFMVQKFCFCFVCVLLCVISSQLLPCVCLDVKESFYGFIFVVKLILFLFFFFSFKGFAVQQSKHWQRVRFKDGEWERERGLNRIESIKAGPTHKLSNKIMRLVCG